MRKYKCDVCGGIFDHFVYHYDSSPRGDDETSCPLCGALEAGADVIDEDDQ